MSEEKVYTAKEAAELLGISAQTVSNYIKAGKIKAVKFFGSWRIKESDLKPYLELMK